MVLCTKWYCSSRCDAPPSTDQSYGPMYCVVLRYGTVLFCTEVAYAATRTESVLFGAILSATDPVSCPICLRFCYTMPGTDLAYGPTICFAMPGTDLSHGPTNLQISYAINILQYGSCAAIHVGPYHMSDHGSCAAIHLRRAARLAP
eukprot:2062670-Rhodomonas_salina.1